MIINPYIFAGAGGGELTLPDTPFIDLNPALLSLTNGADIETALDGSGNAYHADGEGVSATKPTFETNSQNGFPSYRFNSSGGVIQWFEWGDIFSSLTAAEVFVILKLDAQPPIAENQTGLWTLGAGVSAYPYVNDLLYNSFGTSVRQDGINPDADLETYHCLSVYSAFHDWKLLINDIEKHSNDTLTVFFGSFGELGATSDFGWGLQGNILRFIMFDRKLTNEERTALVNSANDFYGLGI